MQDIHPIPCNRSKIKKVGECKHNLGILDNPSLLDLGFRYSHYSQKAKQNYLDATIDNVINI